MVSIASVDRFEPFIEPLSISLLAENSVFDGLSTKTIKDK